MLSQLGIRRRFRQNDRAIEGSCATRPRAERNDRTERHLGESVAWFRRRAGRDFNSSAESRPAQIRRHELRRDRSPDGQGSERHSHGQSQVVISIMQESDVRAAVTNSIVTYGSDSGAQAEDGPLSTTKAHPRAFGTFPRILAEYVRAENTMPLEEAVRKMTSQAASRVGIMDRGILRQGMMADVTLFDPAAVQDVATYNDPLQIG